MPALFDPWVWKMAWRDSRPHRRRLALFTSSIVLGVAALVSVRGLGDSVERAVDGQARSLLGADLAIRGNRPFDRETEALIDSVGGERSREVSFHSMVFFPRGEGSRLVDVRALEGGYPYYGTLEAEPPEAGGRFQEEGTALLDNGLMMQFGAGVGDSVRLGRSAFRVGGRLLRLPGETQIAATLAPPLLIPLSALPETGLIQRGSRVTYQVYFRLGDGVPLQPLLKAIRPHLDARGLWYETVESRKGRLGRNLENLTRFLNLVGFAALLLGCVGVASAVHVHVRQKLGAVSVLRCLGAGAGQVFSIYLIQAGAMGLAGTLAGALGGLLAQRWLPVAVGGFLPVEVAVSPSWPAVRNGLVIGLAFTLLFALIPLLPVRRVSPLRSLRAAYEGREGRWDPLRLGVALAIALLICGLGAFQTGRWRVGLGVTAGLAGAFGGLAGVALLLKALARRFFPGSWGYVYRQGLANLHRPHNQTQVLMLSLGLGTFLIGTLFIAQHALLRQVALAGGEGRPNLVMFDIQSDQAEEVAGLIGSHGLPILHRAPVVTLRLTSVKGRDVAALMADSARAVPRWALTREYRATYRDRLFDSERILSGTWTGRVSPETSPVPVSLAEDMAGRLRVGLGDSLTFDVQGVPVLTVVGSLREVDWQRVQPNFWMVFPAGVLEQAPQFHVLTARAPSAAASAAFQRELVRRFPGVSSIDLGLVLKTADEILSHVASAIRFMALFSVLTGLAVLGAAALTSRYQRVQEGALLRTLGASRGQVVRILLMEYLFLGGLAALTGLTLALGGGWALTRFVFEVGFAAPVLPLALLTVLVTGLTALVGMLSSRRVAGHPPLEVLRQEG